MTAISCPPTLKSLFYHPPLYKKRTKQTRADPVVSSVRLTKVLTERGLCQLCIFRKGFPLVWIASGQDTTFLLGPGRPVHLLSPTLSDLEKCVGAAQVTQSVTESFGQSLRILKLLLLLLLILAAIHRQCIPLYTWFDCGRLLLSSSVGSVGQVIVVSRGWIATPLGLSIFH